MARSIGLACTFLLLLGFYLPFCFARDFITLKDSIIDGETITSAGKTFQLGFFTPGNRRNDHRRYVGIWYYRSVEKTIVWVANREHPLNNTNGAFGIGEDGNLVLFEKKKSSVWITNLTDVGESVPFKRIVKLLDSGNLVLCKEDEESGLLKVIWASFKNPTDTFLPGMKMDESFILNSWESPDNPAEGKFKFQLEENHYIIKKERLNYYWKSGVSGKFMSDDILPTVSSLLLNSTGSSGDPGTIIRNSSSNHSITASSSFTKTNLRLVMDFDGKLRYFTRINEETPWTNIWGQPADSCSVFKACGNFASCNDNNSIKCECLPGFKTISPVNWNSGHFSEGCRRTTDLCIGDVVNVQNFSSLKVIKVGQPDGRFEANNETECKTVCLKNCNCQAYSYILETSQRRGVTEQSTCWTWSDDLNNIQVDDSDGGREIHLRVPNKDAAEANQGKQDGSTAKTNKQFKQRTLVIAVIVVGSVTVLACIIVYIYKRKTKVKKQEDRGSIPVRFYDDQRHVKELIDTGGLNDEDKKGIDLPFFDFESILAATDNFSEVNKLGKGGFGPVYKGKFPGGQEIAIKRLSRASGQGMEEFKNEIVLIARLQHRNLVRLLGYCIEGDEKILLYEFMPNKSLDSFIFDSNLSELLDWEMRFNIILGIARGLLYLHQDSRLRIIHRDFKTSNILLDEEMNPKISDFGLARIFEGKQTEGATNRVVGTYGYMSPEYALDGFFSVKSDVFSFGVVVLEIICGKRNTGFYNSQEALSLLGYAWRLWQEDKALDMMDQKLSAGSKTRTHEILKCINVGLLCVQEDPDDRPTMSDVVISLSSVTATLPTPKRPAFVVRRVFNSMASTSSSSKAETKNEMTITLEGR